MIYELFYMDGYTDVQTTYDILGDKNNRNQQNYYAISNTDTASYFYRTGKTGPFKQAISYDDLFLDSLLVLENQTNCQQTSLTVVKSSSTQSFTKVRTMRAILMQE